MISHSDRHHKFLFSLPGLENVDSARKEMIRRVYDVCIYSLFLGDVEIARKAFGLLLRCKEFKWKDFWSLAVHMLNPHDPDRDDTFILSQVEQLRSLMVRDRTRGEELLNEVLQVLIQNGQYREALEEIELYLPLSPHQDDPVLFTYAGLIRLYMSQEPGTSSSEFLLEKAKDSLNRALQIDPANRTAHLFLDLIALTQKRHLTDSDPDLSEDEVSNLVQGQYMIGNAPKRTKRGESVIRQAVKKRYETVPPPPTGDHKED